MSRTGKIAKLPPELREELNRRLECGVSGRILVEWLNALPAVQEVLRESFEGNPVNEQNLCAWRRGGFADWQTRREFFEQVRDVAADHGEFEEVAGKMAGHAVRLLSAHYALALSKLPSPCATASDGPAASSDPYASLSRLKPLAAITRTVVALHRREESAARLKMEEPAFAIARHAHSPATPPLRDQPRSCPSASPAPAKPLPPPVEKGNQGKLSQKKAPEMPPAPAPLTKPKPVLFQAPNHPQSALAALSPPRLQLTFPPLPVTSLPVSSPSPFSIIPSPNPPCPAESIALLGGRCIIRARLSA